MESQSESEREHEAQPVIEVMKVRSVEVSDSFGEQRPGKGQEL